jgi:P27 family predicted phage terminase small subunit
MRGRKPGLPAYLKLVKNVRPNRINQAEARPPRSLLSPPEHLSDEAKEEWARVAEQLHSVGILTALDRSILEAYCVSWARWRAAERILAESGLTQMTPYGSVVSHPALAISRRAAADTVKFATELGMTPASRGRIRVNPNAKQDSSGEFFDT